jgi:hypothetical protein
MSDNVVSNVLLNIKHLLNEAFAGHQVREDLIFGQLRADLIKLVRNVGFHGLESKVFDRGSA